MTGVKSTFSARREDWRRHVADLQTRTYEGAAERPAKEQIFREAFTLVTPVAVRVLEALDEAYLGGRGTIDTTPPRPVAASDGLTGAGRQPVAGMAGWWSLTWPELEQARSRLTGSPLPPVQIFAMFPDDFTHPHLALFDLGPPRRWIACWPLQVRTPDEAERQEPILAAIAEGEMHDRTFEGDLNWRLLHVEESAEARTHPMTVRPAALSEAEKAAHHDLGFLVKEDVLAGAELEEIRAALEDACGRIVEAASTKKKDLVFGGDVAFTVVEELGVRNLVWEGPNLDLVKVAEPITQVDERLERLWSHPLLVELAKFALGVDEVAPFTDKFNAKRAQAGGEFLWHQDHPFWYSIIRRQARDTVTIGVFADDATAANGALVVVPRTQHGPLPRRSSPEVMLRYHADDTKIDTSGAVVAEVSAGGVVMFGPFMLHRSGPNQTDGDRRVLLLTFQPAGRPRLADFDYEPALLAEQWMDELP